jgi:hypothetical protein
MPDVEQHGYRAYPLVDHIADKVAAMFERSATATRHRRGSKDLVDLVAIVTGASVSADAQMAALASEADRRGITLLRTFAVPDRNLWQSGYAAEASRSFLPMARSLDDALAAVVPFIDPLLDGSARGRWDPARRAWRPGGSAAEPPH